MARVSALTALFGALLAVLFGLPVVTQEPATASPDAGEPAATEPAAPDLRDAAAPKGSQIIEYLIRDWPDHPRRVARAMIVKYGPPDRATTDFIEWRNNGPWRRTVVHRDESVHNFPVRHTDVLEQAVLYQVPPEKIGDLARFDGSLRVDRTKGELVSNCGSEAQNILALNLADDILQGQKTVEQARESYARTMALSQAGKSSATMEALQFTQPVEPTAEPDKELPLPKKTDAPVAP